MDLLKIPMATRASKDEVRAIAEEVLTLLKKKELPIWQCCEALRIAKEYMTESAIFK